MTEPVWLLPEVVLLFHEAAIAEHGGASGVRDGGLLESALARPRNAFEYGGADLIEMAAAYAAGIVQNHPFIDGNKRTGLVAAIVFLERNGYHFSASEEQAVSHTLALAAGALDEAGFAAWLRANAQPR